MSGESQTTPATDACVLAGAQLPATAPNAAQLQVLVQQIREMVRFVDNARDAVLLVRRSNAVGRLVDEALKTCRALEEQQFELRQDATEAHLRTLRRAGELLGFVEMHAGGRPAQHLDEVLGDDERPPTLRELGIANHESHRWQRIAKLPGEWFEGYIHDCREHRRELTTSGLLVLAKRFCQAEDEAGSGEERPSGKEALFREYEAARDHISNVIWLDPVALARALDPVGRQRELDRLRRWRTWLDEFEMALAGARARPVSAVPGPSR